MIEILQMTVQMMKEMLALGLVVLLMFLVLVAAIMMLNFVDGCRMFLKRRRWRLSRSETEAGK